jgi:hypothetical protein
MAANLALKTGVIAGIAQLNWAKALLSQFNPLAKANGNEETHF